MQDNDLEQILQGWNDKLIKALAHLEYSYKKVSALPQELTQLDEEKLETWESFCARFSRVSDIFLGQYLRTRVLVEDPGFQGTLRDSLNKAEKMGLLDDAKLWLRIRELRNRTAHEYNDQALEDYFKELLALAPHLLAIDRILHAP